MKSITDGFLYVNQTFSAGMLRRYISNKISLIDFIPLFNRALSHQVYEELVVDHIDFNEKTRLKTSWPMETQMMKAYVKKICILFGTKIFESHSYCVNTTYEDEELVIYIVNKVDKSASSRSRRLTYNKHSDYVSCTCR